MGVPAVSYRATTNDDYDYGFYRLPNMLSHQCFNFEELQQTIKKILCGELGVGNGEERQTLIDHYLAAQKGALACERIIDVLEKAPHAFFIKSVTLKSNAKNKMIIQSQLVLQQFFQE